jgi:UPF0716 protein FxsA
MVFLLWPFIEIYALVKLADSIGGWNVFLYLVASAVVGLLVIQMQGRATWLRFNQAVARGQPPNNSMVNGLMGILGGVLLIVPGVFGKIIGLLMIFPLTRPLLRLWFQTQLSKRVRNGQIHVFSNISRSENRPPMRDVIDIEKTPLPPGESDHETP